MSVYLSGLGCVTPWGMDLGEVYRRVAAGERVVGVDVENPETGKKHPAALVPPAFTAHLGREPRLRRASPVSMLAAAAGRAAMEQSGLVLDAATKARTALVFGVSSGGVQYTRRFYEQVVKQGANAASPMLFPETVYNAPASHLAAMLGLDGATYTLVGDGTVGLQALHFGAQLLEMGEADQVLVVAAEELDWILIEAHYDWRLTDPGALLAEGAAAVVLARKGALRVHCPPGQSFVTRAGARAAMDAALRGVAGGGQPDVLVDGCNDTWVDPVMRRAVAEAYPGWAPTQVLSPRRALGEAVGASSLLQVVLAAEALRQGEARRALVAALGWNQQAAAAVMERV